MDAEHARFRCECAAVAAGQGGVGRCSQGQRPGKARQTVKAHGRTPFCVLGHHKGQWPCGGLQANNGRALALWPTLHPNDSSYLAASHHAFKPIDFCASFVAVARYHDELTELAVDVLRL